MLPSCQLFRYTWSGELLGKIRTSLIVTAVGSTLSWLAIVICIVCHETTQSIYVLASSCALEPLSCQLIKKGFYHHGDIYNKLCRVALRLEGAQPNADEKVDNCGCL